MYVNGKISPIDAIPGMEGGKLKEKDRGSVFNCDNIIQL
jgi:hypothetical protein